MGAAGAEYERGDPEADIRPRAGWTSMRLRSLVVLLLLVLAEMIRADALSATGAGRSGLALDSMLIECAVLSFVWLAVIFPGGLLDAIRARRFGSRLGRHPREPWIADHQWNPRGATRAPSARLLVVPQLWITVAIANLLVSVLSRQPSPVDWTVFGLLISISAWSAWRAYGVGTMHVTFAKFPYHPGETVKFWFGGAAGAAHFEHVTFTLRRYVEEPGKVIESNHFVHRAFELRTSAPADLLPGGDRDVEVSFDVPADAGGTHLSDPFPRWWTLEVSGRTSAGPYCESFLIPIYERTAPGTDVA